MTMMITTRKLAATDTQGERVFAQGGGMTITTAWDYSLGAPEMHAHAARCLAQRVAKSHTEPAVRQAKALRKGYVFEVVL